MSGKAVERESEKEPMPNDAAHQMMEEFDAVKKKSRSSDRMGF